MTSLPSLLPIPLTHCLATLASPHVGHFTLVPTPRGFAFAAPSDWTVSPQIISWLAHSQLKYHLLKKRPRLTPQPSI